MTIPPLSQVHLAASVAGTDRAASGESRKAADAGGAAAAGGGVEKAEAVERGKAAGDSDGDGRQMLDTFERGKRDEHDDSPEPDTPPPAAPESDAAAGRDGIDFQA